MKHSQTYLQCTDLQWSYIRMLLKEAFVHHCSSTEMPNLDIHHMPTHYTKQQASLDIETLKRLKSSGWK